jgi:hypothetical protein
MYIPDLPAYLVFYLKTTRGSSIYSTYLIYPDLPMVHAANNDDDNDNNNDDNDNDNDNANNDTL